MSQRLAYLNQHIKTTRLQQIRSNNKLDPEELKDLLFGTNNFNKYIKPTIEFIDQNRHIFTHHNLEDHNHKQQRQESTKMILKLRKIIDFDLIKDPNQLLFNTYALGMFDGGINAKTMLQYFLHAKSILLYQSRPLHMELYKKAISGQDLGCFALTEFHHGSYSKGIQTLAVYDKDKQQFVLTTQGTKGMKFWIGALSELANTTILWAQLIINGKSEGPHPFYLPIRSHKTHKVLPGITIGDCGPKKGLNYLDNGYMILDSVRIPKDYLLGKYGDINENGQYYSPISNMNLRFGLHMSALSSGRGFVSFSTITSSLNATTIALRYAHARKQFETTDKKDEITIIDYPLTQIRLIPQIAMQILQIPASYKIADIYSNDANLFQDDLYINEMHALSAAVKARYTWNTLKAAEECRTILGGHGYSSLSRIPSIVDDIDINTTWQGDNNVLLQQSSKFILKIINKKIKTKLVDFGFIYQQNNIDFDKIQENVRDISLLQSLFQDLMKIKYNFAQDKMNELSSKYKDKEERDLYFHPEAGNSLALTYADYYTFTNAKNTIEKTKSQEVSNFLKDCLYLWAFCLLQKQRYGPRQFRNVLQKNILELSSELVSRCVIATDILTPSSFVIGSPFADPNGEGFKEYISLLFSKKDTFTRAKHYKTIIQKTSG